MNWNPTQIASEIWNLGGESVILCLKKSNLTKNFLHTKFKYFYTHFSDLKILHTSEYFCIQYLKYITWNLTYNLCCGPHSFPCMWFPYSLALLTLQEARKRVSGTRLTFIIWYVQTATHIVGYIGGRNRGQGATSFLNFKEFKNHQVIPNF